MKESVREWCREVLKKEKKFSQRDANFQIYWIWNRDIEKINEITEISKNKQNKVSKILAQL